MMGAFGRRDALRLALAAFASLVLAISTSWAADNFIIVQSTTSTQNSGLFEHILPIFTKKTGIDVRVVAVGTGQALKNAENGDGDVVFVHSEPDEEKFVADGWGVKRYPVMYNDFIIVGPANDPAKIAGLKQAPEALKKIAETHVPFASEGLERQLVSGNRLRYGRDIKHGGRQAGLRADRSGHLVGLCQ